MAGALSVADFALGSTHSINGPWGCDPPTQALVASRLAWLVGLIPPAVFLGRSPGTVRASRSRPRWESSPRTL